MGVILAIYWIIMFCLVVSEYHLHELNRPARKKDKKKVSFYRTSAWRSIRYRALKHYGATCMCCGASRESGDQIHVDHILPRSKFKHLALEFSNLAVLCQNCNVAKSNIDFTDWRNDAEKERVVS